MEHFDTLLAKYADFIVRVGCNVQPGQTLIIGAPLEAAPLARLCAASAFDAGEWVLYVFYAAALLLLYWIGVGLRTLLSKYWNDDTSPFVGGFGGFRS